MKLWVKIYCFSLLLLILTLNIAGFTMIQKFHNDSLKNEVDRCISEEKFISMQLEVNSINNKENSDINSKINSLIEEYKKYASMDENTEYIEILDGEDKVLYKDSNFPISKNKDELKNIMSGEKKYVIRTINDNKYLYISSLDEVYNSKVKVYYAKNISNIFDERNDKYILFGKLSIMICSIFAIFMFFISRLIMEPINTLIVSTEKIIIGDYSERVKIKSKDEFKILSNHFNKMAETVEDKINELERSNMEKEALINNLTHELKTPLTSIIGYSNIIRTSKYDEKLFFECADYIYNQGKRLEKMTFKMMDLIYSKTQEITLTKQNVMPIIEDVKKSVSSKLINKNVQLIIEGEDCVLNLDKDLITMALCNIVENAIKASSEDSKIYIRLNSGKDKTSISVQDFGIGIAKEHVDKIFQPFYVVDKARSRKHNGAGIGLAICKKIADVHGANITIDSKLNKGTKITLDFTTI